MPNKRTRRSAGTLTHAGLTLTIEGWAEHVGIHHRTLRSRLRAGWSVYRTLTEAPAYIGKRAYGQTARSA